MILSSFGLKIIAIITMFCDHLGYVIYHDVSWMNYIGRLAFPIFAWQISIGADKTKNEEKYFYRLLLYATISQPVFILYNYLIGAKTDSFNILFLLSLGVICISAFKKKEKLGIVLFAICAIFAEYLKFEYGFYGILMIMIFYLFRNNKPLMIFFQIINLAIYVINTGAIAQIYCIFAILPILLYNQKKGKNVKYLFYIFYPIQFLILDLIMLLNM